MFEGSIWKDGSYRAFGRTDIQVCYAVASVLDSPQTVSYPTVKSMLFMKGVVKMAKRPKKKPVERVVNPDVLYVPCGFCCTMMEVPKSLYEQGGIHRCKKCGMGVRYSKHKIVQHNEPSKFSYRRRVELGINDGL